MALIKCSECGKDISEKASACPFCGNPVGGSPVTIQRTNKKWKASSAFGIAIMLIGVLYVGSNAGVGVSLLFLGFVIAMYAKIGAWWTNG